jgi:AsmA family protein
VLAMTEGRVARDLFEKASTDLRVLFRAGEGTAAITCLLGVMTVQHGIGTIAPLALHTPDTNLEGGGTIDLVDRTIDLTIKADKSASILALAIPLRLSGDLSAPRITPALGASLPDPPNTADITAEWRPALRDLAARNACLR